MKKRFKYIPHLSIIIGFLVALIGHSNPIKNQYVLIIGIVIMLSGIYKLSVTIPSKNSESEKEEDNEA